MDWPVGDACRIGSTAASTVIAVTAPLSAPDVATTMMASPLLRSARVAAGIRAITCWRSDGPPCPAPGVPAERLDASWLVPGWDEDFCADDAAEESGAPL